MVTPNLFLLSITQTNRMFLSPIASFFSSSTVNVHLLSHIILSLSLSIDLDALYKFYLQSVSVSREAHFVRGQTPPSSTGEWAGGVCGAVCPVIISGNRHQPRPPSPIFVASFNLPSLAWEKPPWTKWPFAEEEEEGRNHHRHHHHSIGHHHIRVHWAICSLTSLPHFCPTAIKSAEPIPLLHQREQCESAEEIKRTSEPESELLSIGDDMCQQC